MIEHDIEYDQRHQWVNKTDVMLLLLSTLY